MDFPVQPDAVTPAWLTTALRASGTLDQAEVVSVAVAELHPKGTTGVLALLRLGYDVVEPGAPTTLVAKFSSPHPELRAVVHSMGFFEREIRFYQRLAATTPVRTPRCYFADVDAAEGWSLLLLEDLTGVRNGSWLAGSALADVALALDAIAPVHAAWWESPVLAEERWLELAGLTSVPELQQVTEATWKPFLRRLSAPVTPDITAVGELVRRHLHATARYLLQTPPLTLVHHDFDGDNLFFAEVAGRTELVVIDWQLTTRGHAAVDVAWLVAGQCETALRREHEQDLVRRYHGLLVELGVADYPLEQCWDDYPLALLLAAARISSAVGFQPGPVGGFWDDVFPRYSRAIADLRVGELLERRSGGESL